MSGMNRRAQRSRHSVEAILCLALVAATLFHPARAHAGKAACLTGSDPAVAGDAVAIRALRPQIDAACPCASFDGSKGKAHSAYTKCTAAVIGTAITSGNLRKPCKGTVKKYFGNSTCGQLPSLHRVVCIKRVLRGNKLTCSIQSTTKKDGTPKNGCLGKAGKFDRVPCPAWTLCLDAADTNGDLVLASPADSGQCNPSVAPSPTPTSTPNGGVPPVPVLGAQIDRVGRPGISILITGLLNQGSNLPDQAEDQYNVAADPASWSTSFGAGFRSALAAWDGVDGVCGNQLAASATVNASRYATFATLLADDRLYLNATSGSCSSYLHTELASLGLTTGSDCGGRVLGPDVVDTTYSWLTTGGSPAVTDGVTNDSVAAPTFPFLSPPN